MKSPSWRIALVADGLVQRDGLTRVLLDLQHLLRRDVHFLGQLFGRGLAAQVLQQLTLDAAELVDHLDHVHRDADGAGLVGHGAGDGLADPPGRVGGELVTLGVVELFDRADQAQVAFLDQVEERHAAAGVALGQRHHQAQVRFQQMVLRAVAVAADPRHVAALGGGQLLALLGQLGHQLGGIQAGLDALGQLDLFLGVEQRDLADLLEVGAYRVGRRGELGVLAGLAQRLGFLFVPDEVAGRLVLLAGFGDLVILGGRYVLGGFGDRRLGLGVGTLVGGHVLDAARRRRSRGPRGPGPPPRRRGPRRAPLRGRRRPQARRPRPPSRRIPVAVRWPSSRGRGWRAGRRPWPSTTNGIWPRSPWPASRPSDPWPRCRPPRTSRGWWSWRPAWRGPIRWRSLPPAGFAAFAARAFLAGVLVAVRFTGSSVAGLAFVAATYTLSVLRNPVGRGMRHRKASAMSNVGVDLSSDTRRYSVGGRRRPL